VNEAGPTDDRHGPGDRDCRTSGTERLRGAAVVVAEQSAEAFAAANRAVGRADAVVRLDQLIPEPLMVPFAVIVGEAPADRTTENSFAKEEHSIEALFVD